MPEETGNLVCNATPTGRWQVGGVVVDFSSGEMGRGGEALRLTPKATEILHYLMMRQGRVVTKEEIMTAVWPDSFVSDDSVWRSISELRASFGDDPEDPTVVETLPRRGYRLIAEVKELGAATAEPSPLDAVVPPRRRIPAIRVFVWLTTMGLLASAVALATGGGGASPDAKWGATGEPFFDGWLEDLERALEVERTGRGPRIQEGLTAVGYNSLLRAAKDHRDMIAAVEASTDSLMARGRLQTAVNSYQAILEIDPQRGSAGRLAEMARSDLEAQFAELERLRRRAEEEAPSAETWVELATAQRLLEDHTSACQALREALRFNPAFEPALVEQVKLHLALGDAERARSFLEDGLARLPDSYRLWSLAAEAALLEGQSWQAVTYLDQACRSYRVARHQGDPLGPPPFLCWN